MTVLPLAGKVILRIWLLVKYARSREEGLMVKNGSIGLAEKAS
jgi:hypothetical protein